MADKRTFKELRKKILKDLAIGQKTVNQISSETSINWKTVDNHLIHLVGRGFAREVFVSRYVKIYEITERGKAELVQQTFAKSKGKETLREKEVKRL